MGLVPCHAMHINFKVCQLIKQNTNSRACLSVCIIMCTVSFLCLLSYTVWIELGLFYWRPIPINDDPSLLGDLYQAGYFVSPSTCMAYLIHVHPLNYSQITLWETKMLSLCCKMSSLLPKPAILVSCMYPSTVYTVVLYSCKHVCTYIQTCATLQLIY